MVTIPTTALPTPLRTSAALNSTDPRTRAPILPLAAREGIEKLEAYINGMCRGIRCEATGTDLITLTPIEPTPLIEGYRDYDFFIAVALNTSAGAVTATVVPSFGTLATLKVYINGGSTQAGVGDIVAGRLYVFIYADHLDGSAGGLVAK